MSEAITCQDLYLSLPGFLHIEELEICEERGQHSTMRVKAVMAPEFRESAFYELPETVSLNYILGGKETILFKGVVSDYALSSDGGNHILELEALDATYWMDIDRKRRCFQDGGMTVSSVIAKIMEGYGRSDYLCNVPDEPIGELIFQYEETDWEFLKRFMSKYKETLYPDAAYETIHFQAGLAVQDTEVDWDRLPYRKRKDFGRFAYLKKNGFPELLPVQLTCSLLDAYDVAALGSRLRFKGQVWHIAKAVRSLRGGVLVNACELEQKEALQQERYYNPRIVGISQYAVVADTRRDRVQAAMEHESLGASCYWFPFSSVAASSDGSGWYCMPEKGESVRIYFPTEKEGDAYVITCAMGHAPGGADDPMGNPGVRSISTAAGNQVQFDDEGILIAAKKGTASVSLKHDGEVAVSGTLRIDLSPVTSCSFSAKTIHCETSIRAELTDDSGADIAAGPSTVSLNANEIHEN